MNFKELKEQFVRTPDKLDCNFSVDNFADSEMAIYGMPYVDPSDLRFKAYWLASQIDTDTQVGTKVYYFDDELIAASYQSGRKSDCRVSWVSKDAWKKVHMYLTDIAIENESTEIELIDDDDEIGVGIMLNTSYLPKDKVILHGGEEHYRDIERKAESWNEIYLVGVDRPVKIYDCIIPYKVQ